MNRGFIFSILVVVTSCISTKVQHKEIAIQDFKFSLNVKKNVTDLQERNALSIQPAIYQVLYIGSFKENISVSCKNDLKKYHENNWRKYRKPDSADIALIIDTSIIIPECPKLDKQKKDRKKKFKAFPVYIMNKTTDTLNIGYGYLLPIILEAKDEKGFWRPIEEKYLYRSGTGIAALILPPGEMVITSVPVNHGNFNTKLRLRYYNILSGEFSGSINQTQFETR